MGNLVQHLILLALEARGNHKMKGNEFPLLGRKPVSFCIKQGGTDCSVLAGLQGKICELFGIKTACINDKLPAIVDGLISCLSLLTFNAHFPLRDCTFPTSGLGEMMAMAMMMLYVGLHTLEFVGQMGHPRLLFRVGQNFRVDLGRLHVENVPKPSTVSN